MAISCRQALFKVEIEVLSTFECSIGFDEPSRLGTALYEIKLHRNAPEGPLGTFRIRYRQQAKGGETVTEKLDLPRETLTGTPSRNLRLAAGVAEFAEILRKSYWAKESSFESVAKYLAPLLEEYDHTPRVVELLDLVNRAAGLADPND